MAMPSQARALCIHASRVLSAGSHAAADRPLLGAIPVCFSSASQGLSHDHAQPWHLHSPSALAALPGPEEDRGGRENGEQIRWVFLGPPGVGKGTYASRLGRHLGVPHISTGDLVRDELKHDTALSHTIRSVTSQGRLLSDHIVLGLLAQRLEAGRAAGERGFILDGVPRNTAQAGALEGVTPVDLAVSLSLRQDVLLSKLLGRRMCSECGGNFNVADISIAPSATLPGIVMPPLPPPDACHSKMTVRVDDCEEVVRSRLQVYYNESKPVEEWYRERGQLLEFEITAGIPETWPRLLHALGLAEQDSEPCYVQAA